MKYSDAGVDREGGYEIVERIRSYTASTHDENVLDEVGGFGGLYRLGQYADPVLVSGTDGVGTKLHLAVESDYLEGVGIDCVAMCVNDILCHGAAPLFFLDYLAYADLVPAQAARIVYGVSDGCRRAGCSLIGGESAQMPGTYRSGDFDLAGFAVGVVERGLLLDGKKIRPGDSLIGLASSGIHSNGFSLVRALIREHEIDLQEDFEGRPLWKTLLEPTMIYVKPLLPLIAGGMVRGMAHITGGGLYENVPRMFPAIQKGQAQKAAQQKLAEQDEHPGEQRRKRLQAVIRRSSLPAVPVFKYLQSLGVDEEEMLHTFNMGIGLVIAVEASAAETVIQTLESSDVPSFLLGAVTEGENGVCIE